MVVNQSPDNSQATAANYQQVLPRPSRIKDRDVLPLLQTFMEDSSQRSAIIFANPEDLRQFELRRALDGTIVEWSRLLPTNRNLYIFIFHQDTECLGTATQRW
ncbi:hypothetical protein MEO40_01205 [Dolichospermum sp. ST_sed1]|nr:hypothetical protein [Dolichospermum sp. ST_sed1]MDD1435684.1 hypothetical protein [Dolichospermum sp. ST_sed10]MDD1440653.1 hypothetical protein [Dolichospermum sp. ST_sed3]MDD1446596.1 hypothetical protein [Dolichospermum sp. ST_sed8]MDD1455448.1 hypothetical protein [Dolichospermum sp. ST_sed7]MDD1460633.1 hypothetical protein [Dolichospermum sp. ST_sed2]MDD1471759.1 hypothetical protein [Dolichospermum sp. ST_sed4]